VGGESHMRVHDGERRERPKVAPSEHQMACFDNDDDDVNGSSCHRRPIGIRAQMFVMGKKLTPIAALQLACSEPYFRIAVCKVLLELYRNKLS